MNAFTRPRNLRAAPFGQLIRQAAVRDDADSARELIGKSATDVDARDEYGNTALHHAAAMGSVAVAEVLLAAAAEPDAVNNVGQTPLHVAATVGRADVANLLLASGANSCAEDDIGWTPLHRAAAANSVSVVEILLRYGAAANGRAADGSTPLHCACSRPGDRVDLVAALFAGGADLRNVDNLGRTPVQVLHPRASVVVAGVV
ncbi:MAG: ankyrin repeat domain-containing protein [Candidatus Omnitrophota bacterium]